MGINSAAAAAHCWEHRLQDAKNGLKSQVCRTENKNLNLKLLCCSKPGLSRGTAGEELETRSYHCAPERNRLRPWDGSCLHRSTATRQDPLAIPLAASVIKDKEFAFPFLAGIHWAERGRMALTGKGCSISPRVALCRHPSHGLRGQTLGLLGADVLVT